MQQFYNCFNAEVIFFLKGDKNLSKLSMSLGYVSMSLLWHIIWLHLCVFISKYILGLNLLFHYLEIAFLLFAHGTGSIRFSSRSILELSFGYYQFATLNAKPDNSKLFLPTTKSA